MARKKENAAKADGNALPYVQIAAFCDLVLREESGPVSAIRIIDTLNVRKTDAGEVGKQFVDVNALVGLKSGAVKGRKTVKLTLSTPSGVEAYHYERDDVVFKGEGHGVTIHVVFALQPTEPGLYWCDVQVDGHRVTRMPLRVVHQEPERKSRGSASKG